MNIIEHIHVTLKHLRFGLWLAPLFFLAVVAAEGLQHIVEWRLGMYDSLEAFKAEQDGALRLGFGLLKATSIIIASYFIPRNLNRHLGNMSPSEFNQSFLRLLYKPNNGVSGLAGMLALCIPTIFLHFEINMLAIGNIMGPALLLIDSIVVGAIGLIIGTAIWVDMSAKPTRPLTP